VEIAAAHLDMVGKAVVEAAFAYMIRCGASSFYVDPRYPPSLRIHAAVEGGVFDPDASRDAEAGTEVGHPPSHPPECEVAGPRLEQEPAVIVVDVDEALEDMVPAIDGQPETVGAADPDPPGLVGRINVLDMRNVSPALGLGRAVVQPDVDPALAKGVDGMADAGSHVIGRRKPPIVVIGTEPQKTVPVGRKRKPLAIDLDESAVDSCRVVGGRAVHVVSVPHLKGLPSRGRRVHELGDGSVQLDTSLALRHPRNGE
jgi:hypothetical protein